MGVPGMLVLAVLPVVAGSASDDERVVALRVRAGCDGAPYVQCSGILLSPRAVLTAAHCIETTKLGLLEVVLAGDAGPAEARGVRVAMGWTAPSGDDLAVIALVEPVTGPRLATVGDISDASALIGTSVVVTGYGVDGRGGAGVRLTGVSTVRAISANRVELVPATSLPCVGDSGGPVFVNDQVVAVSSFGDEACSLSATSARADTQRAFIDAAVADADRWPTGQPAPGEHDCGTDPGGCRSSRGSRGGALLLVLGSLVARRRRRRLALPLVAAAALLSACGSSKRTGGECNGNIAHGAKPPNGRLFWCADEQGRKDGRYQEWWPKGALKVDAMYREGNLDGPFVAYHENGKRKEEGRLQAGLRTGRWQEWHPDGALRREADYLPGGDVRFTTFYDGGGPRWVEGSMRGQKEHGRFVEWSPAGTKIAEGDFDNGVRLDGWSFWNDDGTPSAEPRGMLFTGE